MPLTYPAEEINDVIVTGRFSPKTTNSYWPSSLPEALPVDSNEPHPKIHFDGINKASFVDDQFRQFDALERIYHHLLRERSIEVQVSVFKQTDDIAHVAWDESPLHEIYDRADEVVSSTLDYLEAADEEFLLIALSDHGFGPVEKTLFLNNVLRECGHITLELHFLWNVVFLQTDVIVNTTQLWFGLAGMLSVYVIGNNLELSTKNSFLTATGFIITPIVLIQPIITYVDLAFAGSLLASYAFLFEYWRTPTLKFLVPLGLAT